MTLATDRTLVYFRPGVIDRADHDDDHDDEDAHDEEQKAWCFALLSPSPTFDEFKAVIAHQVQLEL